MGSFRGERAEEDSNLHRQVNSPACYQFPPSTREVEAGFEPASIPLCRRVPCQAQPLDRELPAGLEPATCDLQGRCSAN